MLAAAWAIRELLSRRRQLLRDQAKLESEARHWRPSRSRCDRLAVAVAVAVVDVADHRRVGVADDPRAIGRVAAEDLAAIDRIFRALADETRRELILRLSQGPASVSELACPLSISLAAVVQHVHVLEDSGIVKTRKVGRVRTCDLDARGLLQAERWIAKRRAIWEGRLDRLAALLESDAAAEPEKPPKRARAAADQPRPRRGRQRKPT